MDELKNRVGKLQADVKQATERIKLEELQNQYNQTQAEMTQPDFWNDNQKAQESSKQASQLLARIAPWQGLIAQIEYLNEFIDLNDAAMQADLDSQLSAMEIKFDGLKKELRFQGPYDDHDVILSIHAGAGGTDAQDWAQMLLRMYVRWAEGQGLQVKTVEQSTGEGAGIKSVMLEITGGSFLYGKLAGEHGVHRLVRISPFNSGASRETSFAKVEILPMIDKPDEVQLDDKDLKVDVYRAGGHGGQSVNTTDSAVRITHIPTSLSVSIQNERSQLQNKETALAILRSRLAALQLEQHAASLADVKGPNQSAEFGNQIRNYVLHPYKQVKDNRTGYESSDVEKVLNGELNPLIDSWINRRPA